MSANDRKSVLDERHERAIAGLVSGRKPSLVAADVGVTHRQLNRWRTENAAFAAALAAAQNETYRDARERVVGMLDDALDAVNEMLADKDAPAAVRIRAAEIVISRTLDAKRDDPGAGVSADDARLAFREFARANPAEAKAIVAASDDDEAAE